jgi:hypothetical protein
VPPAPEPPSADSGEEFEEYLQRRRPSQRTSSGRIARRRDPDDLVEGSGLIRRHDAAIGMPIWIIQLEYRHFEIKGGLEAAYQVEGMAVRFEGRVDPNGTAVLEQGQVLEIIALAPR